MADQSFTDALNEQISNEFAASQQYIGAAVYYDAETLPRLAAFFYRQAVEERNHAMMMVQYLLDANEEVRIPDIEALPFPPRMVNLKPSRLGGLRTVCEAIDHCALRGIGAYGGGQFELGPGRGQIQYLASLFHPDTPNDVAPTGFHHAPPPPGLPESPIPPAPSPTGFGWAD